MSAQPTATKTGTKVSQPDGVPTAHPGQEVTFRAQVESWGGYAWTIQSMPGGTAANCPRGWLGQAGERYPHCYVDARSGRTPWPAVPTSTVTLTWKVPEDIQLGRNSFQVQGMRLNGKQLIIENVGAVHLDIDGAEEPSVETGQPGLINRKPDYSTEPTYSPGDRPVRRTLSLRCAHRPVACAHGVAGKYDSGDDRPRSERSRVPTGVVTGVGGRDVVSSARWLPVVS